MELKNQTFIHEKLYDKKFREKIIKDPKTYVKEVFGESIDADSMDYVVLVSTKDTMYITMPYVERKDDIDVGDINAAGTSGCAGSASTASSVGTFPSTVSSAGSTSTASTVGSN